MPTKTQSVWTASEHVPKLYRVTEGRYACASAEAFEKKHKDCKSWYCRATMKSAAIRGRLTVHAETLLGVLGSAYARLTRSKVLETDVRRHTCHKAARIARQRAGDNLRHAIATAERVRRCVDGGESLDIVTKSVGTEGVVSGGDDDPSRFHTKTYKLERTRTEWCDADMRGALSTHARFDEGATKPRYESYLKKAGMDIPEVVPFWDELNNQAVDLAEGDCDELTPDECIVGVNPVHVLEYDQNHVLRDGVDLSEARRVLDLLHGRLVDATELDGDAAWDALRLDSLADDAAEALRARCEGVDPDGRLGDDRAAVVELLRAGLDDKYRTPDCDKNPPAAAGDDDDGGDDVSPCDDVDDGETRRPDGTPKSGEQLRAMARRLNFQNRATPRDAKYIAVSTKPLSKLADLIDAVRALL